MNKANIINVVLTLIIVLLLVFFSFIIFKPNLTKADFFNLMNALITFIVGGFAIYLYLKQKADKKRNAAKIIIQEVRRAEKILANYKKHNNYVFNEKLIATNSWAKNIHYFVDDLNNDELDKISELYSTGEYLDSVIQQYSIKAHERDGKASYVNQEIPIRLKQLEDALTKTSDEKTIKDISNEILFLKKCKMDLTKNINEINAALIHWEKLFKDLTYSYESVYNSSIGAKLRKIAQ